MASPSEEVWPVLDSSNLASQVPVICEMHVKWLWLMFFLHSSFYDFCDFQWTALWVIGDPGQNAQQVVEVAAKRGPGRRVGTPPNL